jgi:hypothetical protein
MCDRADYEHTLRCTYAERDQLKERLKRLEEELDKRAQIAVNAINQRDALVRALEEIAEQGESLAAMGEPQNGVPEFCRAILRGEKAHLRDIGHDKKEKS